MDSNERGIMVDEAPAEPTVSTVAAQPAPPRREPFPARLNRIIGVSATSVAALATILLMLHVTANVVSRKIFAHPLPDTLETSQFWYMPVLALLGIVGAQAAKENLRADLLFGRFPPAARTGIAVTTNLIAALISLAFTWFSWNSAQENMAIGQTAGISSLIIWPIGFVVPIAFLLMAILYIVQIFLPGFADPDTVEDEIALAEQEAADITLAPAQHEATTTAKERRSRKVSNRSAGGWILVAALLAVTVGSTAVMLSGVSKEMVGGVGLVLMIALLLLRVPIALTLIIPAIIGLWAIRGANPVEGLLSDIALTATASWSLTVVPMFVFMGLLIWRTGVTTDLYRAARDWLNWLPGGLAVGTNAAGAALSAVSGSTVGQVYALARVGIPEMLRTGYRPRYTVAAVISSGLTGQLIPPSIMLVIYAGIAEVSTGQQLIAGVVPGILILLMLCTLFVVLAKVRPAFVGKGPDAVIPPGAGAIEPSDRRWRNLLSTWPVMLLIVVIIVGMFSGWVTATEVGATAALISVILAFWRVRGGKAFGLIGQAAMDTARSAGAIFFLVIGGYSITRMLTLSGLTSDLAQAIVDANFTPITFMLILLAAYLVMGMFLDPLAIMLLTVPIIMPTLGEMGISPLWFGVFLAFLGELAIIIPPHGMLPYIVHSILQPKEVNFGVKIKLSDVFIAVTWVLPVAVLFLLILIAFPQIATFLPDMMQANPGG